VAGSKQIYHGKTLLVHIPALEMVHDFVHGAEHAREEVASGGEAPNSDDVLLAVIPEMESPGRSKRRAESSMEQAERIKAARNLDFDGNTNHSQPSSLLFSDANVLNNLGVVGILLGNDKFAISSSLLCLINSEMDRISCQPNMNKVDCIFDLEEKEELENEEVDKLILNSLCSEIMDEVMNLGSAFPKDCNTTPIFKSSSTTTKRASKKKKSKKKILV
jgi:hypothetical protein